ncbi:WapI family immunity protein [Reichenbachiella sp.]|uniref:WapI family immunity protein n=1 Tax=Reichenbachiella sp. TaxID=2184521 RepID=UPI003B59A5E2
MTFELQDSGNFLKLTALEQLYPNSSDWDQKFLSCSVELKSGAFSGNFNGEFMVDDFKSFSQQLQNLYKTLKGTANFNCLEDYVNIVVTGDGIGHLSAKCVVTDSPFPLNSLQFELEFDQTYLPNIINDLDQIVSKFS